MSRWHTTEFDLLPERAFKPRGWKCGMTLEGGKGDAPAPDPRMGEAAVKQIQLNEKIYNDYRNQDMPWMRNIAEEALGISRRNSERAGALSDYQLETMKFNDNRYRTVGIPLEDQLLEDVKRFDSQGYKDQQIAAAMGDVQQGFSSAAEQQRRGLSRMGVNPNSGKFAAANANMGFEQAKAMANAANKTRAAAEQVGLSTKMQMYGGMKGLAGLGATNAGLATGAIGAGNQSGAGMTGAAGSYLSANNSALGAFNSGMSAGISGLGNYSNLGISAANVNAQNDPFNTVLGAAAGVATSKAMSDRRTKKNIRKIGELADGLGVYQFQYKHGGGMQVGVMADEVKSLRPWAYIQGGAGGYDAVDYGKL